MSITSSLVSLSLCALVGGAVLHWMSSSKEVALASYPAQMAEGRGRLPYSMPVPPPAPPASVPTPPLSPMASSPQPHVHGVVPSLPLLVIASCKGVPGSANLRATPSLYGAVLSVVSQGDPVLLLGDRAWGDGEEWIYVRTATLQEGWVAACFE